MPLSHLVKYQKNETHKILVPVTTETGIPQN